MIQHRSPLAASRNSHQRGMALIAAFFAVILILTLLAVMVDVGTMRLRRTTQEQRSIQALAAADAGAAWVRAILEREKGDVVNTSLDLARAHSTISFAIDPNTSATLVVTLEVAAATSHADHLDMNLEENAQIREAPLQVSSTATVSVSGTPVATRTVTTLLRAFHGAPPFSELVGVIDDAGPESVYSPGDPAGQVGAPGATELRLFANIKSSSGHVSSASKFGNDSWFDGNTGSSGFLP